MLDNFAGIGSRETPKWCLPIYACITSELMDRNCHLRSGGASGSDSFFEWIYVKLCVERHIVNQMEIYLPDNNFNGNKVDNINYFCDIDRGELSEELKEMAMRYHPRWGSLSDKGKRFMMRNCQQVMGRFLRCPSKYVICYTQLGEGFGGTGQALRIAKDYRIPVFDVGSYEKTFSHHDLASLNRSGEHGRAILKSIMSDFINFLDVNDDPWF